MNIGLQFCYYIILLVVLYYFSGIITSRFKYFTLFDWWNKYKSPETINTFNPMSISLYNKDSYSFNIHQLFIKNQLKLSDTEISFLQQKVLNNLLAIDDFGNPQPDRFIKPKHLSRTICWNNEDTEVWPDCGIKDYYAATNWYDAIIGGTKVPQPDDVVWSTAPLYYNTQPYFKPDVAPGGFWPNQNGCAGFFDTPQLALDATPSKDPGINALLNPFNAYDNFPEVGKNRYVPGFPGCYGSWAQLFADWGIVYSNYSSNGFSNVPVISDGASCKDASGNDYCSTHSVFPKSDFNLWNKSSMNKAGRPGINFFALNKINPASYLVTSWVSGLFNNSKIRKALFDPQSIPNLLGAGPTMGYGRISGGWLRFIKCLNTNKCSVDKIINQICREYASNLNTYYIPPDDKNCKDYSLLQSGARYTSAVINGAGMGLEFAPLLVPLKLVQTYMELNGENKCSL